nr:hypothetical protein [Tanacetum cinerariifolium]
MSWRILFTFVIQVLDGNYSSTKHINYIQEMISYGHITRTEVNIREIIYSDLVTKLLSKSGLKYISYPRFISCALEVLLGSGGDKNSEGFKLPADMEPQTNPVTDPSRTDAKYQADQTQSARLRMKWIKKFMMKMYLRLEKTWMKILRSKKNTKCVSAANEELTGAKHKLMLLVILNGDSPVPTRLVKGVAQPVALTNVEQKLARKNELKARGTLLMALPDKHQ